MYLYCYIKYKRLKGKASISTDDLISKLRCGRNQHSIIIRHLRSPLLIQMFIKVASYPRRDWNALPDPLITSAENAEDFVAKFTLLVRARD